MGLRLSRREETEALLILTEATRADKRKWQRTRVRVAQSRLDYDERVERALFKVYEVTPRSRNLGYPHPSGGWIRFPTTPWAEVRTRVAEELGTRPGQALRRSLTRCFEL